MRFDLAISLSVLIAVLCIGTLGAFLLYVPALAVFTVVVMILGLGLMFALGLLTGTRWRRLTPFDQRSAPPVRKSPAHLYVIR